MKKIARIMIIIITSCALASCPTKLSYSDKPIKTPSTDNTQDCAKG